MANFAAFFTLAVLCISGTSSASSVNPSPLSNWESVSEHLTSMQELVIGTMMAIYTDALEEDELIGAIIGQKVNEAAEHGVDLLKIVQNEVDSQTLTVELARAHLGELLVVFTDLHSEIQEDLDQLSEGTRDKINNDFTVFFIAVPGIADRIYRALEEPAPISCGLLGLFPNVTISPDTPLHAETPPGIVFWNATIFQVAQTYVMIHPHNKYLDSEVMETSGVFWVQTTLDFPKFVEDTNTTSIHRVIMFQCLDGTSVVYQFEFPLDTEPIVEPTLPPRIN